MKFQYDSPPSNSIFKRVGINNVYIYIHIIVADYLIIHTYVFVQMYYVSTI